MDWIELAQNKESWRAVVNAVRSGSIKWGNLLSM